MKTVCVTGCLGFIGSHFTRACLKKGWRVWGIDKKTYASREEYLAEFGRDKRFGFQAADIAEMDHLYEVDFPTSWACRTSWS
jgi:nucleoside-diphosphate-sugar epimerase